MKFFGVLKEILFPNFLTCDVCEREVQGTNIFSLCNKCYDVLPRNNGKTCIKCGESIGDDASQVCLACKARLPKFTKSFAPLLYKGAVTKLIKNFKYDGKLYISKTLGNFIVECYIQNNLNCNFVLPVPLHANRLKKRGFNQAELLCHSLQEKLHLPIYSDVIVRERDTPFQTRLGRKGRRKNVDEAFRVVNRKICKGATILLVDDVYTTGATLSECAEELFSAGAKAVYCITVAHTMGKKDRADDNKPNADFDPFDPHLLVDLNDGDDSEGDDSDEEVEHNIEAVDDENTAEHVGNNANPSPTVANAEDGSAGFISITQLLDE